MIEVSPFAIINALKLFFRMIYGGATKWIFYSAYVTSDKHYHKNKKPFYRKLTEHIEYFLKLETKHFSNIDNPKCYLLLRQTERCNKDSIKISGYVFAGVGNLEYQEYFCALVKREKTVLVYLPKIPLKELRVSNNGIIPSYDNVFIEGEQSGDDKLVFRIVEGHPTFTEYLNSVWVEKWGYVWNLDHLYEEIRNFRFKAIRYLSGSFGLSQASLPINSIRMSKRSFVERNLLRVEIIWCKLVVNFLCGERPMKFLFWILISFRIIRLA